MNGSDRHLHIGTLLYDGIDQIDVTGPFEVLSRLPARIAEKNAYSNREIV